MATASLAEARSHNVPPEVFLRHWREIRDCKQAHADTGMALARSKKAAKTAGIDMDAVKMLEKWSDLDEDELMMQLGHMRIYAGWLKLPIGTQIDMFKAPAAPEPNEAAREEHEAWEAGEAGLAAGKSGRHRDENPHEPGDHRHAAWDKAWIKGNKVWLKEQRAIAAEMGENAEEQTGRRGRRRQAADASENALPI